jgi:excisionase family DNA binding protein
MHPSSPDDPGDPILTTREAAKLLGIAVSTAQLWIENGLLPAWKTPGGHRRVRWSDVSALLRERAGIPNPAPAPDAADFLPAAARPLPDNEQARLEALRASKLVGSGAEAVFDRLTWRAKTHSATTRSPRTGRWWCPMRSLTHAFATTRWSRAHRTCASMPAFRWPAATATVLVRCA